MNILLLLVPLSLLLVGVAAWAFAWAVRRGQFDDLDTPALDVLRDDRNDQQIGGPAHAGLDTPAGSSPVAAPGRMDASMHEGAALAAGEDPHAD